MCAVLCSVCLSICIHHHPPASHRQASSPVALNTSARPSLPPDPAPKHCRGPWSLPGRGLLLGSISSISSPGETEAKWSTWRAWRYLHMRLTEITDVQKRAEYKYASMDMNFEPILIDFYWQRYAGNCANMLFGWTLCVWHMLSSASFFRTKQWVSKQSDHFNLLRLVRTYSTYLAIISGISQGNLYASIFFCTLHSKLDTFSAWLLITTP